MRVRAEGGEDAADVGALERIGDLNPEKSEAQVEHLRESQVSIVVHKPLTVIVFV
jgi:hypothetical protein